MRGRLRGFQEENGSVSWGFMGKGDSEGGGHVPGDLELVQGGFQYLPRNLETWSSLDGVQKIFRGAPEIFE